jgi:tripartite-type tricarboxylate transporter receptor subunit TctC
MNHSIPRRHLCASLGAALCAAWLPGAAAWAADPQRPVRLIVPTPAGSAADALARALTAPWARISGRPIVVENVAGAGTTIGTAQLARGARDGLTLGVISSNHTINPSLYRKLPYDPLADFTPILMIGNLPAMVVVNNDVPARTPAELARVTQSARVPLAEGIVSGTAYHLVSELFKDQSGVTSNRIFYKGSAQILNDLLGGTLQIGVVPAQSAAPLVAAGKLRAIAVTTSTRTVVAPQVPTLAESGLPRFEMAIWLAIVGPAGLEAGEVAARRREIEAALLEPEMRSALTHQGIEPVRMSLADMPAFLRSDLERNRAIIQRVGITID